MIFKELSYVIDVQTRNCDFLQEKSNKLNFLVDAIRAIGMGSETSRVALRFNISIQNISI